MRAIILFLFLFPFWLSAQTAIDFYNESNCINERKQYSGSGREFAGQSFTNTDASVLGSFSVYYKKVGTVTGNINSYLYSHTGTYGTTSAPGTLMATGSSVAASTLSTSYGWITFTFQNNEQISLLPSTYYCLVVNYSGGNTTNYVAYCSDNTTPTHAGTTFNGATIGNCSAGSQDVIFSVYTDSTGISKLNQSSRPYWYRVNGVRRWEMKKMNGVPN